MKKLYISADIEGVCGIEDWRETELADSQSAYFRARMTAEVAAACEGATLAGVEELFVKDAHDSARNIDPSLLPENARILRGWSGDPESMMAGLDSSFDGVLLVGYHSGANTAGNPLSHTMSTQIVQVSLNGVDASEFLLNTYTAASLGVPVLFLSGDAMLCRSAKALGCGIRTVAVSEGHGGASLSIHPRLATERIRKTVAEAVAAFESESACVREGMKGAGNAPCLLPAARIPELPQNFVLKTRYREHAQARKASFFPGARTLGSHEVEFSAATWREVLVFMLFNY
jgi:D-amino peptidase